jgi:DNA replication protein DnaC
VSALSCEYRELLESIGNSYNSQVTAPRSRAEANFADEVLLIDELGQPTEWVWDTVAHLINTRYNDHRTTIITTNYTNLAHGAEQRRTCR